ncbi:MAG TPA: hypothetical protein VNE83_08125 [Terriglobales bacterium]|nr:hypothetical protein [Terriglobales bacterium]
MPVKVTLFASDEAIRRQLAEAVPVVADAMLAGPALELPQQFLLTDPKLRQLQSQNPEAVIVAIAADAPEAALSLAIWLRTQMPAVTVIACGPMHPPQLIVRAMQAGAAEYLELPLRPAALAEALQRLAVTQAADAVPERPRRGKLIAVPGARGGCGATTVAVNLALALYALRRQTDQPVVLVDAAPLGHAALHLNLKPMFNLVDLLANASRLDAVMLGSLTARHGSGLDLMGGPAQPLPVMSEEAHGAWLDRLLLAVPLAVVDLSARWDDLTRAVLERADRILFITQTDMVSLWSAAKVRQYLDPERRLRFEMILNRYSATPEVDTAGLEAITGAPVLWKLPNAHALVCAAIERGQPPVEKSDSELATSFRELAAVLLGRPQKKQRAWLPFLRARNVEA